MIVGALVLPPGIERHDRRVDHAQTLEPVHAQLRVDDGILVRVAHTRRANRVVDQHQAPAQVGFEIGAVDDAAAPGLSSFSTISRNAACAAISRASRMPAISDSTSSGSESVFVMIRGLALGSAERSQTLPARLGRDEHGRDHRAMTVVGLGAVVFVVGGAHVELDVGGRQPAARAREGDDLGDGRA